LTYEDNLITIDCCLAPLEDRLFQEVPRQSHSRLVVPWNKQAKEFEKQGFREERVGRLVTQQRFLRTVAGCEKVMAEFSRIKLEKFFSGNLKVIRWTWYGLAVGLVFFFMAAVGKAVL
jgi:hypothetical protein